MNILLSIHHKYAKEIMNGTKRFEYRKMTFHHSIHFVYLYESYPIKRITSAFKCNGIIYEKPLIAWQHTHNVAGINKKDFFNYYANSSQATLIKVGHIYYPKQPLKLSYFGLKHAPMSFRYLR